MSEDKVAVTHCGYFWTLAPPAEAAKTVSESPAMKGSGEPSQAESLREAAVSIGTKQMEEQLQEDQSCTPQNARVAQ